MPAVSSGAGQAAGQKEQQPPSAPVASKAPTASKEPTASKAPTASKEPTTSKEPTASKEPTTSCADSSTDTPANMQEFEVHTHTHTVADILIVI